MANLIADIPKEVIFKDLDKDHQIDQNYLQNHMFDDDFEKISLLKALEKLSTTHNPILFYPGSGADIIFPCLYVEYLFPKVEEITFHFMDINNCKGLVYGILDSLGVSITKDGSFCWNGILIHLIYEEKNVFHTELPKHDIYFEKAFRIMKDSDSRYEDKVLSALNEGGVLISDSGFQKLDLQRIDVPVELSSYKEMIIGVKK
ncbi:hypothetical protein COV12_01200 [Candidatus Woesearchaeota archaeon CG10_big_fil_rev_8_21_14_0_10_32_24]|nr:MAG: hypothetical protein COV12_01200 [Candidatus Woesearchaeota archaeon CG10_big_fil_rev_8_21_14_0_10_32_24]